MLSKVRVRVGGKINLSLNIEGKIGDMHLVDSIVAPVKLCDFVTVRDRLDDKINLIFNSDFSVTNNSVIKAVNRLRKSFGNFGADIIVEKHLPLAGGMGGSSADAAGVIAALSKLFDFDKRGLDLYSVCSEVGSDVLYMLKGGYARMSGTGSVVSPVLCDREFGLVCVYSGPLETGMVYKAFDRVGGSGRVDNDKLIDCLNKGECFTTGNMLFDAAVSLRSELNMVCNVFNKLGLNPCMTGSGSIIYAISSDPARDEARLNEQGLKAFSTCTSGKGIIFE